jgi:hypothetical protein
VQAVPKLIRFVVVNSLIGIAIGFAVAFGLVWFNINGLGDMFARSDSKAIVALILGASFGSTFGFAYVTTAVLLLPTDKDDFDKI